MKSWTPKKLLPISSTLLWLLPYHALHAEAPPISPQAAQSIITATQQLLTPQYPDFLESWQNSKNPFCAFIQAPVPPPPPPITQTNTPGNVSPVVTQLQEDTKTLQGIAPLLAPSGIFKRDNKTFLIFNSNVVHEGGKLKIKYRGRKLTIHFQSISDQQFTITLNQASQTIPLSLQQNAQPTSPQYAPQK